MIVLFMRYLLLAFFMGASVWCWGQEQVEVEPGTTVSLSEIEKPLTIDLNAIDEEDIPKKKKKVKKKVYYGLKTKRGYTRKGSGERITYEIFFYLKAHNEPIDPYIREYYWFDAKTRRIKTSKKVDPKYGFVLHGPYKKTQGDVVLEEGIFYKGMKHGRWMTYNKDGTLLDKRKFIKGWPKHSLVSYWDRTREKLKEITPIVYDRKEGGYFVFHDNGAVAVSGQYKFGERVGLWREYYKFRRKIKKEIRYPDNPFDKDFAPYIVREWDPDGKLIYENKGSKRRGR